MYHSAPISKPFSFCLLLMTKNWLISDHVQKFGSGLDLLLLRGRILGLFFKRRRPAGAHLFDLLLNLFFAYALGDPAIDQLHFFRRVLRSSARGFLVKIKRLQPCGFFAGGLDYVYRHVIEDFLARD